MWNKLSHGQTGFRKRCASAFGFKNVILFYSAWQTDYFPVCRKPPLPEH